MSRAVSRAPSRAVSRALSRVVSRAPSRAGSNSPPRTRASSPNRSTSGVGHTGRSLGSTMRNLKAQVKDHPEDDEKFVYVYVPKHHGDLLVGMARAALVDVLDDDSEHKPEDLVQAVPSEHTKRPLRVLREAAYSQSAPDGDALTGFARPSERNGLLLRLSPRPLPTAQTMEEEDALAMMKVPGSALVLSANFHETRTLQVLRRRAVAVPPKIIKEAKNRKQLRRRYPMLVRVQLPRHQPWLDEIADAVSDYNEAKIDYAPCIEELEEEAPFRPLVPLLRESVLPVAAATTITAAYRAYRVRCGLTPNLLTRVLHRRAAICLQRAFRTHLLRGRCHMLGRCKALLDQKFTSIMSLTRPDWEAFSAHVQADPVPPSFFREQGLRYAFAESDVTTVFLIVDTEVGAEGRAPLPRWLDLDMPCTTQAAIDQLTEQPSIYSRSDVLPLLEQDVEGAHMTFSAARAEMPEEIRPHKHLTFKSPEDARQRAGLLYLLTYSIKHRRGVELWVDPHAPQERTEDWLATITGDADDKMIPPHLAHLVIPNRVVPLLPPRHVLVKYTELPRHIQPRFTWRAPKEVRYGSKRTTRDKLEYLAARQELMTEFPLHPEGVIPPRPSTPEQIRDEYQALVTATLSELVTKQFPHIAGQQHLSEPDKRTQARLIREETDRLLVERIQADVAKEMARRNGIRENMDHLTRVLRSVNTSSMSVSNPMHSGAVARLAKLLREEVSRVNAERVREAQSKLVDAKEAARAAQSKTRADIYNARTEGHHERMQAIHAQQTQHELQKQRQVQRRKWQLERKKAIEGDSKMIRAFGCQHNALSKQMINAEIHHLHGLDWHYTCREVDARRQEEQMRKQEVEQEQELAKTLQRELWLEKAGATALAREEVLLEMEAERQAAWERNEARRAQHADYAPRLSYPYRHPPRKAKAPLKLNPVVSAN